MIANVSLEPFAEKNFNPQSFRTLIPSKPVKRGQRFDFFTEFLITTITKQTLKHKHFNSI